MTHDRPAARTRSACTWQHTGHPIAGDDKYGDFALNKALARGEAVPGCRFERMFLHARRLVFDHPAGGQRIELAAPLPADCAALLARLRPVTPDSAQP